MASEIYGVARSYGERICEYCGEQYTAKATTAKYCHRQECCRARNRLSHKRQMAKKEEGKR